MFDELLKELRRLEGQHTVSVPISVDSDGYIDRECPEPACQFGFKIHGDDWDKKMRAEEVHCPFCGHTDASDSWLTQEQVEYIKNTTIAQVGHSINRALERDADRWNRRQPRNSLVGMTMKADSYPLPLSLPPEAVEPMRLKITCSECRCRYAVIGAAFFCPACGHNAAELVFSQTLTGIINSLNALTSIKAAISDRDAAETTARMIIEGGLQNAVTAFQRFAEALHSSLPSSQSSRRNAFQNLKEGSDLWHNATGSRYDDYLESAEIEALNRHFQKRHLLAHTQGIVDENYINRTKDHEYRIGQRIIVHEATLRECLDLIEKLATSMESDILPKREGES